jgi:hypothetical protein
VCGQTYSVIEAQRGIVSGQLSVVSGEEASRRSKVQCRSQSAARPAEAGTPSGRCPGNRVNAFYEFNAIYEINEFCEFNALYAFNAFNAFYAINASGVGVDVRRFKAA